MSRTPTRNPISKTVSSTEQQRQRSNARTKPITSFSEAKRIDPDKTPVEARLERQAQQPGLILAEQEPVEMGTAIVARGHTVHVVTGAKRLVGTTKPEYTPGGIAKEVFADEYRCAGPGESVELPLTEVVRLRGLGFLEDEAMPAPLSKRQLAELDRRMSGGLPEGAVAGGKGDPRVRG